MGSDSNPAADPSRPLAELAEQVERAAGAILRLKEQSVRLQELLREVERRCATLEGQLAERPEVDVRPELDKVLAEKAAWQGERERWGAERDGWQAQTEAWETERARAQSENRALQEECQGRLEEQDRWEEERRGLGVERQGWQAERRDIALRIEQLVQRLEGLAP
jgi:chromosome segregation ATPase